MIDSEELEGLYVPEYGDLGNPLEYSSDSAAAAIELMLHVAAPAPEDWRFSCFNEDTGLHDVWTGRDEARRFERVSVLGPQGMVYTLAGYTNEQGITTYEWAPSAAMNPHE